MPAGAPPLGDGSLHLGVDRFRHHLEVLAEAAEVVTLDQLWRAPRRDLRRPRVALTFDDAYRGAITLGLDELRRRGWPATVFVAPGILGSPGMWWDVLAAAQGSGLAPALRREALERLAGRDGAVREYARAAGAPVGVLPRVFGIATEPELLSAAAQDGVTLAAHSWSHANLPELGADELAHELEAPLAWLRARAPRVLPWLAYPYGLRSPEIERAAARAGYDAALTVERGWVRSGMPSNHALPRLNVPAGTTGLHLALYLALGR